jgi:hypothetical protein
VPPLRREVQAGVRDEPQQGSGTHARPREDRAAPAIGVLEARGQLLVDVTRLHLDQDPAAGR